MRNREVSPLSTVPPSFLRRGQCIVHHRFLCSPSFHKSQDEISVKGGRAVTPRVLETLIKIISN
jgi:hypothetical protein